MHGGFGSREARARGEHGKERRFEAQRKSKATQTGEASSPRIAREKPTRRAGASEESRDTPPSALENAKRGLIRRRQPNGRRASRRFMQDCDPKAYSCMPSGRKDA